MCVLSNLQARPVKEATGTVDIYDWYYNKPTSTYRRLLCSRAYFCQSEFLIADFK